MYNPYIRLVYNKHTQINGRNIEWMTRAKRKESYTIICVEIHSCHNRFNRLLLSLALFIVE